MLVRHDGRRRLVARLGPEAEDGIDALLDQALAYESVEPPSLTGFLAWFDRDEVTVKRRTEEGADQVRVMTVHGAKGLEAPIVILPDTAARQDGRNPPQILRLADGQAVWRVRADAAPAGASPTPRRARRALVREESRRLLYVALTRAAAWLIVCGAGAGTGGASGESWHGLVARGAGRARRRAASPARDGDILALDAQLEPAPAAAGARAAPRRRAAARLGPPPGAARRRRRRAPLSPSASAARTSLAGEAAGARAEDGGAARGTAVHRLLEHLHGRPAADRAALAARLLPGRADLAGAPRRGRGRPRRPGARLPLRPRQPRRGRRRRAACRAAAAAHPRPHRPPGRRRRTASSPSTSRATASSPTRPSAVPEGILRQMGAYRAALVADLARTARSRSPILWTRAARLMPLPAALADAAFARALLDLPGGRS